MNSTDAQAEFGQASFPDMGRSLGISSNRRSRIQGIAESTAKAFALDSTHNIVKEKCEDALNLWPNANAAILYGSRARGNHRADSDWDIAFITSTKESLPSNVLRHLNEFETNKKIFIHGLAIPQDEFYDNANSLGNVVASIAREGRLIAGHCNWPETESELILKPDVYKDRRAVALRNISSAVNNFATGIVDARTSSDQSAFKLFVMDTSDAAEYFAKIAFEKLASGSNEKYPYSHEVDKIVQEIDKKCEHFDKEKAQWWLSDRGREFRDLLFEMNGHGHEDHQYGYQDSTPDDRMISRAANRLLATVDFAIREVEGFPGPAGLQQVALEVADTHRSGLLELSGRLRQILRDLNLDESTFSAAGSVLAKSAEVAVCFGERIAQALEDLADSLSEDDDSGGRV